MYSQDLVDCLAFSLSDHAQSWPIDVRNTRTAQRDNVEF
jgi:hypothetical protein